MPHWYSEDWYNIQEDDEVNCTNEQMHEALQGHMSLSYKYFGDDNQTMLEGITVREWKKKYENVT